MDCVVSIVKEMSNTCKIPMKVPGGYLSITVEIDNGAAEKLPDDFPTAAAWSLNEEMNDIIADTEW